MAVIHIVDGQNDYILDDITQEDTVSNNHKKSLPDTLETFHFTTFGNKEFSKYLTQRNRLVIPDEDQGRYVEFVINETKEMRARRMIEVYAQASYLDLIKGKPIEPQTFRSLTASALAGIALRDTEWVVGKVESTATRTITVENFTNPYSFLKTIANEFGLELNFRVEIDHNRIIGRFVDLVERIGVWRGIEVEFGKNLVDVQRIEKSTDIVTALIGLGPETEDGKRMTVVVEDEDALQRWGRANRNGELTHLYDVYEPQSEDSEMTLSRLTELTRNELEKRINAIVEYETELVNLEKFPELENEEIRFGDTLKIKDTSYNPPLYLEARLFEMERNIFDKKKKTVKLGDYIEYREEQAKIIWNQLRNEIRRKTSRLAVVSIVSTAGNIFKNAQGQTELTARTFVGGQERDEDGTLYDYQWLRFDKDGTFDSDFYARGKTITVSAADIDDKATYRVLVSYDSEVISTAEITISNVFDGEDGAPGKSYYTWIKYADSPTSGMSDNPEGKEYIGIAYNKESPTPSNNYDDYVWSKFKGEQGVPGPKGEDGQTTYTWVKYADDDKGNGMSDSPEGKKYIGLAFNKTTPQESNNPNDYTWSLMPQNIEIGGRNLLKGDGSASFNSNNAAQYPITTQKRSENGINFYRIKRTNKELNSTTLSIYSNDIKTDNLTMDISHKEVTLSFYARSNYGTHFDMMNYITTSGGNKSVGNFGTFQLSPEWQRYSVTFTPNFDIEKGQYIRVTPYKIYGLTEENFDDFYFDVGGFTITFGSKAIDWTPSPEDLDAGINDAKQTANNAQSVANDAKNTANNAQNIANNALEIARNAEESAQNAMKSADGKNTVFRQAIMPPTTGRVIGDLWFHTGQGNKMYVWTGSSWLETRLDHQALSIGKLSAITADLGDITAGNIIGVNIQGVTGTFGEVTVNEGDITIKDAFSNVKQILTPKPNLIGDHSFEDVLVNWDTENTQYNWYDMINPPYADSDFSIHRPYWTKYGSPKVAKKPDYGVWDYRALPIFDGQAIVVRNANFVRQYIAEGIGASGTYTLSAYFKRHWGQTPGTPRFEVDHMRSGQIVSRLFNVTFSQVPNDYTVVRFAHTFTLPSSFREGDYLDIKISGGDSNWVQCDGVQLVEGNLPCIYDPEITAYEAKRATQALLEPLWEGVYYLTDTQTVFPMLPLSQCRAGWVLRWQAYNVGQGAENSNFQYTFIPKLALQNPAHGHRVVLMRGSTIVTKYFYIYDTYITGLAANGQGDNRNLILSGVFEY